MLIYNNVRNLKQIGEERVGIYVCFYEFCFYRDRTEVRVVIHLTYCKIKHIAIEFYGELNRGNNVTRKTT